MNSMLDDTKRILDDNKTLKSDSKKILNLNKDISKKINVIAKDRVIHTDDERDKNHLVLINNGTDGDDDSE